MFKTTADGILLDIEGTTSSISFVYEVMFPFVRENLADFLQSNWGTEPLHECLVQLADDLDQTSIEQWLGEASDQNQQSIVESAVIQVMDRDVKATGLKQLQGMIWKSGFLAGQLVAHLFEDVAPAMRQWHHSGIDVRIYSSGSIAAQQLFFGHTVAGDLRSCLNGYYDTTTGAKQSVASYEAIARTFPCPVDQIIFLSDVPAELIAAKSAGMKTFLSLRPGNHPVDGNHDLNSIRSFAELQIESMTKKE
jgi:enolase-phosphatase E1